MDDDKKYLFSFTAASMRLNDSLRIARYILDNPNTDIKKIADPDVILGYGKSETNKREFRELLKRILKLTEQQAELYVSGNLTAQKQIAYLSICKTYGFIKDFTIEVIRDKFLVYDYQINEGDYQSFLRRKQELHHEMDSLTETTLKKVRAVTFLILEEAGIIDKSKNRSIQPQLLEPALIRSILEENPNWLKIFLIPDQDIDKLKHENRRHK
jgi:hypothetical protein